MGLFLDHLRPWLGHHHLGVNSLGPLPQSPQLRKKNGIHPFGKVNLLNDRHITSIHSVHRIHGICSYSLLTSRVYVPSTASPVGFNASSTLAPRFWADVARTSQSCCWLPIEGISVQSQTIDLLSMFVSTGSYHRRWNRSNVFTEGAPNSTCRLSLRGNVLGLQPCML